MDHIRLDPCIDSDPDIEAAGFWGARVFELLLKVAAWKDLRGRVTPQYLQPAWLARRWNLTADDCGGTDPEIRITLGLSRVVAAGLAREDEGSLVIRGWEKFYKPAKTNAQRQEDWRGRNEDRVTPVTKVTEAVTSNATPHHSTPLHFTEDKAESAPPPVFTELEAPAAILEGAQAERRDPDSPGTHARPEAPALLQAAWNEHAHPVLPRWQEMAERERKARARLRERPLSAWVDIIRRISASAFCRGETERGWRADPDFLLRPGTAAKVLEGKYDDRDPPKRAGSARFMQAQDVNKASFEKTGVMSDF